MGATVGVGVGVADAWGVCVSPGAQAVKSITDAMAARAMDITFFIKAPFLLGYKLYLTIFYHIIAKKTT